MSAQIPPKIENAKQKPLQTFKWDEDTLWDKSNSIMKNSTNELWNPYYANLSPNSWKIINMHLEKNVDGLFWSIKGFPSSIIRLVIYNKNMQNKTN